MSARHPSRQEMLARQFVPIAEHSEMWNVLLESATGHTSAAVAAEAYRFGSMGPPGLTAYHAFLRGNRAALRAAYGLTYAAKAFWLPGAVHNAFVWAARPWRALSLYEYRLLPAKIAARVYEHGEGYLAAVQTVYEETDREGVLEYVRSVT